MTLVQNLLDSGATVIKPLEYSKDRAKTYGHMWKGSLLLEHQGHKYGFGMWYHNRYEADMTRDEVLEALSLKRLEVLGATPKGLGFAIFNKLLPKPTYFDANFHVVYSENIVLFHKEGWMGGTGGQKFKRFVSDTNTKLTAHSDYKFTEEDLYELRYKGFEVIFKTDNK